MISCLRSWQVCKLHCRVNPSGWIPQIDGESIKGDCARLLNLIHGIIRINLGTGLLGLRAPAYGLTPPLQGLRSHAKIY